jgi:hypothetical protein
MPKLSSLRTLGTAAGPSLRPDRAQSSNLLSVNGTNMATTSFTSVRNEADLI